jgi:3-oxoacyl-[acyl-carrier protein] reductase
MNAMIDDLNGARILVTGASSGIGAAVASAFARHGASVALHYNTNREGADAVAAGIARAGGQSVIVAADLSRSAEAARVVSDAASALGGLDILVNNAGAMVRRATLREIDEATFDAVTDINVRSAVMTTQAALPHLEKSEAAAIINTSSIAARHGGGPGAGLYAAAKASLSSLTRNWAKELASAGIRVNAVAPGVVETPFHRLTSAEMMETMRKSVPLGRVGAPDDCVGAYLFLASAQLSGYVTGQVIEVNGGQLMA